jgi:hypothetical protein
MTLQHLLGVVYPIEPSVQGSCLGPLRFPIFTNDLPQVLHEAKMTMYADDSRRNMSAPKASELTDILKSIRMGG